MRSLLVTCTVITALILCRPLHADSIPFSEGDVYEGDTKTGTYTMNSLFFDFTDNSGGTSQWLYDGAYYVRFPQTTPAYRFKYEQITDPPIPAHPHRWYKEKKVGKDWVQIEEGSFRDNI